MAEWQQQWVAHFHKIPNIVIATTVSAFRLQEFIETGGSF